MSEILPAMTEDGWIKHDGSSCPLSIDGEELELRCRDGLDISRICCWHWDGMTPWDSDIMAYRIVQSTDTQPKAQEPAVSDAAWERFNCERHVEACGLVLRTREEWEQRPVERLFSARLMEQKDAQLAALTERCKVVEQENERLRGELAIQDQASDIYARRTAELLDELERLRKGVKDESRAVRMGNDSHGDGSSVPARDGPAPVSRLLMTRAPELEHRMGFGDAGKER